jgi:amino acid transporter
MASSGIDYQHNSALGDAKLPRDTEKSPSFDINDNRRFSTATKPVYDSTHRKLKARHIQLIGIGYILRQLSNS